jgi:hypothetical protein
MVLTANPFQEPVTLTLTNNDFANFQLEHCDKDFIPIAYGLWWTSKREVDPKTNTSTYSFDPTTDHGRVDGGGFLWGEYGIGIDFARYGCVTTIFDLY